MTKFKALAATIETKAKPKAKPRTAPINPNNATPSRQNKRFIGGYFSGDLTREIRTLAAIEEKSIQALIGEAFDLLMRDRGKHPFGER